MSFNINDFIQPETYGVIIVNTESIIGAEITKYYGTISSNVVIGVNLFSELFTSLTDIVGGNSGTYEKKMQSLYNEGINKLAKKARWYGANCILGLRVNIDEISGKGKDMLMISMVGTAVSIEDRKNIISYKDPEIVLSDKLLHLQLEEQKKGADSEYVKLEEELISSFTFLSEMYESLDDDSFALTFGGNYQQAIEELRTSFIDKYTSRMLAVPSYFSDKDLFEKHLLDLNPTRA